MNPDIPENQIIEAIRAAALQDFAEPLPQGFSEYPVNTQGARFYVYPNPKNPWLLVKVFQAGDAAALYLQEHSALYALRATGRVCGVIAESIVDDPRSRKEGFQGPYFIAKPFFKNRLDEVLAQTTELDKLDLSAQVVDIARKFLAARWRDWDWRIENDFVAETGRLLRADLDSAARLKAVISDKNAVDEPRYFYTSERQRFNDLLANRLVADSWESEVKNCAIRVAHMFFSENERQVLYDLIAKIQPSALPLAAAAGDGLPEVGPATPPPALPPREDEDEDSPEETEESEFSVAGTPRFLLNFRRKGLELMGRAFKAASDEPDDGDRQHAPEQTAEQEAGDGGGSNSGGLSGEWKEMWLKKTPSQTTNSSPSLQSLSRLMHDERQLLSALLYHLISSPEPGFTLDDFHESLIMLGRAALCDRVRVRRPGVGGAGLLVQGLAPYTCYFELKQALRVGEDAGAGTPKRQGVEKERAPQAIVTRLRGVGRGAWPSKLKSESEDRAAVWQNKHTTVAAVIDGVTEAQGLEASKLAEAELEQWAAQLAPKSVDELKGAMKDIIFGINSRLVTAFKESKHQHQVALVLAGVLRTHDSSFVVIAQAGDSHCIIYRPDGSARYTTLSWITGKLGVTENFGEESLRIESLKLAASDSDGFYRLRLFSDGVTPAAQERLKAVQTVDALIGEAGSWPQSLDGAVGHDDWSLAGIDLTVRTHAASERQAQQEDMGKEAVHSPATRLLDAVSSFNDPAFTFSAPAKAFWIRALAELDIKDSAAKYGVTPEKATPAARQRPDEPRPPSAPTEQAPTQPPPKRLYRWLIPTALLVGIVLGLITLWPRQSAREPQTESPVIQPSATPAASPAPSPDEEDSSAPPSLPASPTPRPRATPRPTPKPKPTPKPSPKPSPTPTTTPEKKTEPEKNPLAAHAAEATGPFLLT